MARLIGRATRFEQNARADSSQIEAELERLDDAIRNPTGVVSAELQADEMLSLAFGPGGYAWDDERVIGAARLASGVIVELVPDEVRDEVVLKIHWASSGDQERRGLGKYIATAVDQAASGLRRAGWREVEKAKEPSAFALEMSIQTETNAGKALRVAAAAIGDAARSFRFS